MQNENLVSPPPAPRRGFAAAFIGGALVVTAAVGNLTWDVGHGIYAKRDAIAQVLNGKAGLDAIFGKPDLFKGDMYLAYDTGNGQVEVFRATLHGNSELTGEIVSMRYGTKGIINGTLRAGTLTFNYASKDPNRPGFGTFILRPYVSAAESDSPVYTGPATYHDCKCADGSVKQHGDVQITQAILSASPELPSHLKTRFFGKGPQRVPVLFPEDVQKLAGDPGSGPCLSRFERLT